MLRIPQTLHGYHEGHWLLAKSDGVPPAALGILDRMTDYSGYLPMGFKHGAYYQGFPCAGMYAFTATWPDYKAPRSGAVLTHTLLLPTEALWDCESPADFARLHRQPESSSDRVPYTADLVVPLPDGAPPMCAPELMALWRSGARPLLRVTDDTSLSLVAGLWASFPSPTDRLYFTFCTMALSMVGVGRKHFDFYQCPRAAVSGFHAMAGSAGWWEDGRRNPHIDGIRG